MKVELHCHTGQYSHTAPDDPNDMGSPARVMQTLIAAGYDVVYLTEHDVVWPDDELAELRAAHPQIAIFPGVELNIGLHAAYHVVILGTNDPRYLQIHDEGQAVATAREEGHLTILAHPWMYDQGAVRAWTGPFPDAMEARSNKGRGHLSPEQISECLKGWPARPYVNASDVHPLSHINRFWIETARPLTEADDIRDIVLAGEYTRHVAESEEG